MKELAVQIADSPDGLEGFLSDVALMTNLDARKNNISADRVTLSTIHQAKGMEWPVVMVPWCSEGLFPSAKAAEEGRLDEERRLFYVVVTRAKDELYMFSPAMRKSADGGMFPVEPSVFVKGIPDNLVNLRRLMFTPDPFTQRQGGWGQSPRGGYSGGYGGGGYGTGRAGYGADRPHYTYGQGGQSPRGGGGGKSGSGGGYITKTTWRR